MIIESIPCTKARYAEFSGERVFVTMQNEGAGADGASQARVGDVTCLLIAGTALETFTDHAGVTRNVGYQAKECDTTNAPPKMLLGAWFDDPKVNESGRILAFGYARGTRVLQAAGPDPALGENLIAITAEPYLDDAGTDTATTDEFASFATLVERAANVGTSGTGLLDVWFRCL